MPRPPAAPAARRLRLIGLAFALAIVALVGRIVYVQGVAASRYAAYGQSELVRTITLPGQRGDIYDRNGHVLAMSVPMTTIIADPLQIRDPAAVAAALAPVLGDDESFLAKLLSRRDGFEYLLRLAPDAVVAKVRALNLPGISFITEAKRVDPQGALTLSFLGQVGVDGTGLSGLELELNALLGGQNGLAAVSRAPDGSDLPGGLRTLRAARPGSGVVLSIDESLQFEVQHALAAEIATSKAAAGMAVIMDVHTGGILAMVSERARGAGAHVPAARALATGEGGPVAATTENLPTDMVFEPGSVMKVATMAGALTDGLVSPTTVFDVPPSIDVGGATFHDAEGHGDEHLTVTQILAQSSNIGTIEVARLLGPERLYGFLKAFGFGGYSGLGFPGESPGLLAPVSGWWGSSMGSVPIGQQTGVTAMQVLDAYAAIANGGVFVTPHLVGGTVDASGEVTPAAPSPEHRVISAATDAELLSMFEQVVNNGTGTEAAVPGYTVAGKTGTAQKPDGHGGYLDAYDATFVGFVPAQRPALAGIVVLDQPTPIYGGLVSAPVFAQIMQYALHLYHIAPPGGG